MELLLRIFMTLLITLTISLVQVYPESRVPDSEIIKLLTNLRSRKQMYRLVSGRKTIFSVSRKSLPNPLFDGVTKARRLRCNSYHSLADKGITYFKIDSPNSECTVGFMGSQSQNCTVSILCNNQMTMAPKGCSKSYMILYDGTIGMQKGCKTFTFGKRPRKTRNGGKDMYTVYRGQTSEICAAFCKEDITETHYEKGELKKPIQMRKNEFKPYVKVDKTCKCGVPNKKMEGRIVSGETASPFEFPWIAAMVFANNGQYKRTPGCGGSLISDRYVLMAAHCYMDERGQLAYKPNQLEFVLHAHVLDNFPQEGDTGKEPNYQDIPGHNLPRETDESEKSVRVGIKKIITHPLYNPVNFDWDVALIQLTKPVNLSSGLVSTICLPKVGENVKYPEGSVHTVAGWGLHKEEAPAASRVLQKVDVQLGKCKEEWGGSARHLCAGFLQGGKDACQGDSGGPLIYNFNPDTNQHVLTGIVSAGNGCARRGQLGLYTNVQEIIQWVYLHMNEIESKMCSRS